MVDYKITLIWIRLDYFPGFPAGIGCQESPVVMEDVHLLS